MGMPSCLQKIFVYPILATDRFQLILHFLMLHILLLVIHKLVFVPQVVNNTGKLQVALAASAVLKSVAQVNVFATPALVKLIIPIDAEEILPEEGHVATESGGTVLAVARGKEPGNRYAMNGVFGFAFNALCPKADGTRSCFAADSFSERFAQIHPTSLDVSTPSGFAQMVFHEPRMEEYVTIYLDDVVAYAASHTLVSHHGQSESVVFVPYMDEVKRCLGLKPLYQQGRLVGGAVIADDYFIRKNGLLEQAEQTNLQGVTAIVGRNDDRNLSNLFFLHNLLLYRQPMFPDLAVL